MTPRIFWTFSVPVPGTSTTSSGDSDRVDVDSFPLGSYSSGPARMDCFANFVRLRFLVASSDDFPDSPSDLLVASAFLFPVVVSAALVASFPDASAVILLPPAEAEVSDCDLASGFGTASSFVGGAGLGGAGTGAGAAAGAAATGAAAGVGTDAIAPCWSIG